MVEFRTVEHARKRLGRRGVGLGRVAVVAGCWWSCFWRMFTGAVNWRLLRVTLVRQEVGLDSVVSAGRLGCGKAMKVSKRALQYSMCHCVYVYEIIYILVYTAGRVSQ